MLNIGEDGACPWCGGGDGVISIDDLDFSLISRTPNIPYISHTCCPPIFPVSIHVPNFTEIPFCLCIFSTLLGAACLSPIQGLVIIFYLVWQTYLEVCLWNRWLVLV